ncbi:hypothetical protein QM806_04265 [Rhodococcus sp. IEGM 1351]|uniref:hypothetical protein n=1 Tax=Rhodococcus sp. IEGM 1351 TaxID=3047089 RepID=UPI0024B67094|nr:hypothetical protein [Rhodococcus sp. IEGM 1351]MDI9934668.1 hypothetical protein [Rhodococcus sp. IEGM 1351]
MAKKMVSLAWAIFFMAIALSVLFPIIMQYAPMIALMALGLFGAIVIFKLIKIRSGM